MSFVQEEVRNAWHLVVGGRYRLALARRRNWLHCARKRCVDNTVLYCSVVDWALRVALYNGAVVVHCV